MFKVYDKALNFSHMNELSAMDVVEGLQLFKHTLQAFLNITFWSGRGPRECL